MTELYLENGEAAGLDDVCRWWLEVYSEEVFKKHPEPIVAVRDILKAMLFRDRGRINLPFEEWTCEGCNVRGFEKNRIEPRYKDKKIVWLCDKCAGIEEMK